MRDLMGVWNVQDGFRKILCFRCSKNGRGVNTNHVAPAAIWREICDTNIFEPVDLCLMSSLTNSLSDMSCCDMNTKTFYFNAQTIKDVPELQGKYHRREVRVSQRCAIR